MKRKNFPPARRSSRPSTRTYPTLREMLRGGSRGRPFRAPWYAGYPNRNHGSWAQSLKRRG